LNCSGKEGIRDEKVKKKEKISIRVLAGQAQITQILQIKNKDKREEISRRVPPVKDWRSLRPLNLTL
jgi:hypothetical protein